MLWFTCKTMASISVSIDLPNYTSGDFRIENNPRNGQPYFNAASFTPKALVAYGNAKRRFFYGRYISNCDMALAKVTIPLLFASVERSQR